MKIFYITYTRNPLYKDPESWLTRIKGALCVMEEMARHNRVGNFHSIGFNGHIQKGGVEYYFFEKSRLAMMLPFSLHRELKKLSPNAIIIRGLIFPLQVILLRWKLGKQVPFIAHHHAERPLRGYKKVLQRLADRCIGAYFFSSKDLAAPWVSSGQIGHMDKVHEAMVVSSTFSVIDKNEARKIVGFPGGTIYLWVGGLNSNKDPLTLVKAFKKFAKGKDVTLYMVYRDDGMLPEVKSQVDGTSSIILAGNIDHDHLLYWYNSADFILSTSFSEGGGTAVCEGMSCGCIPILSDIPSLRWISGNTGLLFAPGNEGELITALDESLKLDSVEQSRKVLQHHEDVLSARVNAEKFVQTLSKLGAA